MNLAKISLIIVLLGFCTTTGLTLVSSSTETLLIISSGSNEELERAWIYPLRPIFSVYLKYVRKLRGYNRSENLPPLRFILAGCHIDNPSCRETAKWLLSQGEAINEIDIGPQGITALHSAVIFCDASLVEFLLQNGSDPQITASGDGQMHGMKASDLLDGKQDCPASSQIAILLESRSKSY
jgi:hypothetical protein